MTDILHLLQIAEWATKPEKASCNFGIKRERPAGNTLALAASQTGSMKGKYTAEARYRMIYSLTVLCVHRVESPRHSYLPGVRVQGWLFINMDIILANFNV